MGDSITEGSVASVEKSEGAELRALEACPRSLAGAVARTCRCRTSASLAGAARAGDLIKTDEVIALIETDKVTIDVRYPGSKPGVVTSISIAADDTVSVGQAVAVVDDDPDKVAAAGGGGGGDDAPSEVRRWRPI